MPKIPLYARGMGSQVDLATGSLGPSAPTEAFAAPGQAMARAGQAIGRAGVEFASNQMEFDNTRKKLEFDFQMKRKNEKTKTLADEYATRIRDEAVNYSLSSQERDMDVAARGLISSVQTPIINEINSKTDITPFQKTTLINSLSSSMDPQVANIKKQAFAREQTSAGLAKDAVIDGFLSISRQIASIEELDAYIADGFARYDEAATLGQPMTGNKTSFAQEMIKNFYAGGIKDAGSFEDLENQLSLISKHKKMTSNTRAVLEGEVESRRKELVADIEDNVLTQIRVIIDDLGPEGITSISEQLRDSKAQSITVKLEDDTVNIPFAGADANFVTALADKFDALVKNENIKRLDGVLSTVKLKVTDNNTSLSDLQKLKSELNKKENGNYVQYPSIEKFNERQAIEAVIDREIIERKPRVLSEASLASADLYAKVASQDGVMNIEDIAASASIIKMYESAEAFSEKNLFEKTLSSTAQSSRIFKNIEFASAQEQVDAINNAIEKSGTDTGAETSRLLLKRVAARDKEIKDDFVGYWMRRNKITDSSQVDASQMIALQRTMGIAEVDIRITDNNTLEGFRNRYDAAETFAEKAETLTSFFDSFGENGNRVLRHMYETKKITLAENVIAKLGGDNIFARTIYLGNLPEQVASYKESERDGGIPSDVANQVRTLANEKLIPYSSSVMGGVLVDGEVIGAGVSPGRKTHNDSMEDLIVNSALFIISTDKNVTPEDATSAAFKAVIGNQYRFDSVNNFSVRYDSSYDAIYPDMTEMLQYSISESPDYLRSVVAPPERFVGESDTDYEDRSNEYFSDLAQRGTWRTTVDNKGVFMVDQLGNLVELLDTADTDPSGLFAGNLIVSMDKLQTVAQDFINFKGMGLEQKRKKLAELGLPQNKTFSYVDDTAIRAWKKLTFAQGALF